MFIPSQHVICGAYVGNKWTKKHSPHEIAHDFHIGSMLITQPDHELGILCRPTWVNPIGKPRRASYVLHGSQMGKVCMDLK